MLCSLVIRIYAKFTAASAVQAARPRNSAAGRLPQCSDLAACGGHQILDIRRGNDETCPELHQFERVRPNGAALEVRGAPMPGGGFVTTYNEISERKRLEAGLSREEAEVLLHHGTEAPFCGGLLDNKEDGVYCCRLCGLPLFRAHTKFESGTG